DILPFIETRDPTAEDGIAEGFLRGMDWLNTATGAVWRCVDHGTGGSPGDAVWRRLDGAGGGPAQETAVFADDGATITAATHGKYAGDTIRKVILRNDDDQSDPVTVTLEDDLAMRVEFFVADDQMGDCTIAVASGDIINGTTDGSVTLKGAGRSGTVIPIGSGEYRFEGETSETLVV